MSKTSKTARKKKTNTAASQAKKLLRSAASVESRLSERPAARLKRRPPAMVESASTAAPVANDVVALMLAWSPVNVFLRQQAAFASIFSRVAHAETVDTKQRTTPRVGSGKSPRR